MSDFLSGLISVLTPVSGSGVITEETRSLESFQGVVLEISGNLVIQFGDHEQIVLRGEDNILPWIDTAVKDGRLKIRYKVNTSISIHRNLEFVLTVKSLDWIETTSSGEIDVPPFTAPTLSLVAKGSGGIDAGKLNITELVTRQTSSGGIELADLETQFLKAEITGSGNLRIQSGKAQKLVLRMTSAGGIRAAGLRSFDSPADHVDVEILGSGDAEIGSINAAAMDVRLTSSGTLWIANLQAHQLSAKISGSGDVKILAGSASSQQLDLSSSGKYLAGDLTSGSVLVSEATIKITGSGSAFPGEIKAEKINLQLTSGGSLLVRRLDCAILIAAGKGSGNISIEDGKTGSLDLHLSSAGNFTWRQLQPLAEPASKVAIRVSGSGNARVGNLCAQMMELGTESAGDIRIETIETEDLKASLKGSGSIHIHDGSVQQVDIQITSAGDFLALDLAAKKAAIRSSGSGQAKLSVSDRLDAIINSSGGVTYRGKPIVSYSKDGSGEIKRSKS